MSDQNSFDVIVVVTRADFVRLKPQRKRTLELLPAKKVYYVGSDEVGELLDREIKEGDIPEALAGKAGFIPENSIISFDDVHALMNELGGRFRTDGIVPRNFTGWYYQQFVKLAYADFCKDAYYMTWDGDTVPCREFSMFSENGIPYLDYKRELHEEYFTTMKKALGLFKVIEPSFISEHMLFRCDLVKQLREKLEANHDLAGSLWWEKILYSIRPEKLLDNSFSEFETYGTFVALTAPGAYRLREWHSFRLAAEFFDINTICTRDFDWLSKDFVAISFEKNQSVREDHRNLFDNPAYQEKLTARQMLEAAQMEFEDGYLEQWDIPLQTQTQKKRIEYLTEDTFLSYEKLGDTLKSSNIDQAYLCYENAAFLAVNDDEKQRLSEKKEQLKKEGVVKVKKTCIIILSYNQKYLMQKCLESIEANVDPETYSLVVLDNASTDGVAEWLKKYADQKSTDTDTTIRTILYSDENLGFAIGCNAAVQYAALDEDILLLNNDTRMPSNALFWLRMGLYEADDVGAVGAVQNYGTKAQHMEVSFSMPEQYMEFGAKNNVLMKDPYIELPKLSGFAMLIRQGLFQKLSGFDERFSPGYFEDDDLSYRIREAGYRLLLCRNSFIYHAGSQSFAKRQDVNELFDRNRKRFIEKWGVDSYHEE